MDNKPKIKSFQDLEVYQNTYKASIIVCKEIILKLPVEEKYNLRSQLRRSCTAIPPLIAEGHAKKHMKKAFQKYLDDALGEINETIVHLSYVRDLYSHLVNPKLVEQLLDIYDKSARQTFNLIRVWDGFSRKPTDDLQFERR